jgi:hypothetical protein
MRHTTMRLRLAFLLPWLGAAACATATGRTTNVSPDASAVRRDAAPAAPNGFVWAGVYEVEGRDFPEGSRHALMTITPRGDGYAVEVQGPPGRLGSAQFVGDSAHIVWDFVQDGPTMRLRLVHAGDSLTGWWSVAELTGPVIARRRR